MAQSFSSIIKQKALELGFDACGITTALPLESEREQLQNWLAQNYQGEMHYMENHFEMRLDPSQIVENAKSVIVVLLNYYPQTLQNSDAPFLAKYAYGKDYHDVVKAKLNQLLAFIQASSEEKITGRVFTDSAPVLERALAVRAGLGWIGRNSMLINPKIGSFTFIGELMIDFPLDYDTPYTMNGCGNCARCMQNCPTQAIVQPKVVNANRCISYLTIENRNEIPAEFSGMMMNRMYGCDICQDVCPWNKKVKPNSVEEFQPNSELLVMNVDDWKNLDETTFQKLFRGSAVKRAKFSGLRRNIDFLF